MSVLKQNQNAYDDYTVLRTVLMGYEERQNFEEAYY